MHAVGEAAQAHSCERADRVLAQRVWTRMVLVLDPHGLGCSVTGISDWKLVYSFH